MPVSPTYAETTATDLTSIGLSWDVPADAWNDGFDISVVPPPSPGNYPITVSTDSTSYVITSLRPGTIYEITLQSLSGEKTNCQTQSDPIVIVTATGI